MSDSNLDGCNLCGRWTAGNGILTAGESGQAVLICDDCSALASGRACPIDGEPGNRRDLTEIVEGNK